MHNRYKVPLRALRLLCLLRCRPPAGYHKGIPSSRRRAGRLVTFRPSGLFWVRIRAAQYLPPEERAALYFYTKYFLCYTTPNYH